ncbi:MAG: zinc ribbon domain-containing protein [Deltaproteobacteria bacterium]|nr:zinc ribbon domain-containing protein [Deltaproteobacteria bacterium]
MPIYEYRCQQCGTTLEAMQRMSDAPLKRCERCGADALERLISQTSFVLKGSGWYATDYKSRPAEAKKEGAGGDAAKSDAPKSDAPKAETPKAAPAKAD